MTVQLWDCLIAKKIAPAPARKQESTATNPALEIRTLNRRRELYNAPHAILANQGRRGSFNFSRASAVLQLIAICELF
jgi:hypothetical protein